MTEVKKNKRINRLNIAISILIAFSSWLYVVAEISPTVTRSYNNIPITCVGLDKLAERGLGVESMSEVETKIKVRLYRTDVLDTDTSNFAAEVDVSNAVSGTNTVDVKVSSQGKSSIRDQSVEKITVKVTSSLNKDVPVTASYDDNTDQSMEPVVTYLDTEKVSVMGAKSQVDKVSYVALPAQMIVAGKSSDNNFERNIVGKPVAMTADGEVVSNIVIRPETVDLTYSAGTVKTVKLKLSLKGSDWLKSQGLHCDIPETVDIKGASKTIGSIETINASADVSGTEAGDKVEITYDLPDGVYIANRSLIGRVSIKK